MRKWLVLAIFAGIFLAGAVFAEPKSGYSGTGNTNYGGVAICGLNYDCGADDGICPQNYMTSPKKCNVCDINCAGTDARCSAKVIDTEYPFEGLDKFKCDTSCKFILIDKTPPSQSVKAPTGWLNKDFLIEVTESDPSGIMCSYSSNAARYDGRETTTKNGIGRNCNEKINVKIGGGEGDVGPNCPYQGKGACTFFLRTNDNSPQKNEKNSDAFAFSIDSFYPIITDFYLNENREVFKIERQHIVDIKVRAQDSYPGGAYKNDRTISGMKSVEIIVKDSNGRPITDGTGKTLPPARCSNEKEQTPVLDCTFKAIDLNAGTYNVEIKGEDFAGNPIGGRGSPEQPGQSFPIGTVQPGQTVQPVVINIPIVVNDLPSVNFVSYSGECKTGSSITIQCDAYDPNQPAGTLKTSLWAGQCGAADCLKTRSWETGKGTVYYKEENMIPPAADFIAGSVPFNGNVMITPTSSGTKSYTILCSKNGQATTASLIVDVSGTSQSSNVPLITRLEKKEEGDAITSKPFTLLWESNMESCLLYENNGLVGTVQASSSKTITVPSAGRTIYKLDCTKGGQTASSSLELYVRFASSQSSSPPRITSFRKIGDAAVGKRFTLEWAAENAETCEIRGGVFAKSFVVAQPVGTAIAAKCKVTDEKGDSGAKDAYICEIGGCVNPPKFQNIVAAKNADQFIILFQSSKELKENPFVKINALTDAAFMSKSQNSYVYTVPKSVSGIAQVSITGLDTDLCRGSSYAELAIDYCSGFVCSKPPAITCENDVRVYYSPTGTCSLDAGNNPKCSYDAFREVCEYGCAIKDGIGVCNANRPPVITKTDLFRTLLP